jgi:hypothetical protein
MPKPAVSKSATQRTVIAIKVNFELNTPDGLRRVIFGLEKDTPKGEIIWKIQFQLFERDKKTDVFSDPVVSLNVEVDTALNDAAEAASHGLTPEQTAHALGPAADDAKAAKAGDIEVDDAKQTVQDTLTAGTSK